MAKVFIPAQLRELTGGRTEVEVAGANLRQIIAHLEEAYPGFGERVLRGSKLAPGLAVAVDNQTAALGLITRVGPQSEVRFVPAVAGG
jgi:molybdopterin converting factor small subunit